jgi:enamine deaminase RidA (YjgF/YER057c/UK114 family)
VSVKDKLDALGIEVPQAAVPVANYVPTVRTGNLVFVSGTLPRRADGSLATGRLGQDVTIDDGYQAARLAAINILGSLQTALGDLEKVTRVVRLVCMVNSTPDFTDHPKVANGASDLMGEVFGEQGRHARAAVGMAALPMNVCVEIEAVVEVE